MLGTILRESNDIIAMAGISDPQRSNLVQTPVAGVHRPRQCVKPQLPGKGAGQVFRNALRIEQGHGRVSGGRLIHGRADSTCPVAPQDFELA